MPRIPSRVARPQRLTSAGRPGLVPSLVLLLVLLIAPAAASAARRYPHILVIVVDTLRVDRLSAYGYSRPTSPRIDALFGAGARFTETRVVEPLTAPSMISMWTGTYPHLHSGSRNGMPMRTGMASLPKILTGRGYRTAALVGNWTLRRNLCGLDEHFDDYREVFTTRRWFLFARETTGDDLTDEALDWVEDHLDQDRVRPFLLWVHYVEPHAPYRLHREFLDDLGIDRNEASRSDRYDTEIAFVDRAVGRLLDGVGKRIAAEDLLVVFVSDHGESLGEHHYWGHGRHLYEPSLRVPFGVTWEGRIPAQAVEGPASNLDLAPTLLGLVGLPVPDLFAGHDWSTRLFGGSAATAGMPPADRITRHQAHRGAFRGRDVEARRKGLLEVGLVRSGSKETWRLKGMSHRLFDLAADPGELASRAPPRSGPSAALADWLEQVQEGLRASDRLPVPELDEETLDQLEALGYVD